MTALILLRPHTHAGQTFGVGDRIEASAATAEWLLAHGIVRQASPEAARTEPEPKPFHRKESKA